MSSVTRARTRAVRDRQRRTGEPYSVAARNTRPAADAPEREDSVPWHAVLAVLGERSDCGTVLLEPAGGRVRTRELPLIVTIGREPGVSAPPNETGLITQVWTQPSPYENQGAYLMGRGTAWGNLAKALSTGASFPITADIDELEVIEQRPRTAEPWQLRAATVLIPGVHQPVYASARIWRDPSPRLRAPRTDPTARPVRLPHVPVPESGEDLAAWIARVGADLSERRQGVLMELLGLGGHGSPIRRIKELTEGVDERTAGMFTLATGLDARLLRALAESSAAAAAAQRARNADKAVIEAREELVAVLAEAMAATCPAGADGYGGRMSLQGLKLTRQQVAEMRSAMRKAGRSLGWKTRTHAYEVGDETWMGVEDERPMPARAGRAVEKARNAEVLGSLELLRGTAKALPSQQELQFGRRLKELLAVICG